MKFSLLPLLAVSFATAQHRCKDIGDEALQTILSFNLNCYTSSNQVPSNDPLDKCYDNAMKGCAGDGNNADAYWKESIMYKTILDSCPDKLPSRKQKDFVYNLIDKCPKVVNDKIRPTEVEAAAAGGGMLRGPVDAPSFVEASEESCAEGAREGQRMVRKLWRDESNSDCDQIFAFPKKVDAKLDRSYPKNDPNFQIAATNNCARDAAGKELASIQSNCFATAAPTSDDCEDVGRKLVRKLWRDESNSDCDQIFAFPKKVDDKLSRIRTTRCTRDAAKSELQEIQTKCFATQAPVGRDCDGQRKPSCRNKEQARCCPRKKRSGSKYRCVRRGSSDCKSKDFEFLVEQE